MSKVNSAMIVLSLLLIFLTLGGTLYSWVDQPLTVKELRSISYKKCYYDLNSYNRMHVSMLISQIAVLASTLVASLFLFDLLEWELLHFPVRFLQS
jgi:hypothetical protein